MIISEGTCDGEGFQIVYQCLVLDAPNKDEVGKKGHWFECDLAPVKMHFHTESIRETNILRIVRDEVSE